MIEVGILDDPRAAQALIDYMRTQGLEARWQLSPIDNRCRIQVSAEHQARGLAEFERFMAEPYDPRYMAASWHSNEQNVRFEYVGGTGGRSILVDFLIGAGPLTLGLFVLVAVIWLLWTFGLAQTLFQWLHFFPSWQAMTDGQWWRVFTPSLIHFSWLHVIFNLLWWWILAGKIEQHRGVGTLFILLLVAGTLPNIAQFAISGPAFGGLSGVVYALVGYCWISGHFKPTSPLALPKAQVGFLLIWLVLGFTGLMNMANAAHLGGLLIGMAQAFVDRDRPYTLST